MRIGRSLIAVVVGFLVFAVFIGMLHLKTTPAFLCTTVFTAGFMFLYLEGVAFRKARG